MPHRLKLRGVEWLHHPGLCVSVLPRRSPNDTPLSRIVLLERLEAVLPVGVNLVSLGLWFLLAGCTFCSPCTPHPCVSSLLSTA